MSDAEEAPKKDHNKYRRPKPWDHEGIDHWKIEEWKPEYMAHPLQEESMFATLFPAYLETYLREIWSTVTRRLSEFGVDCELNLVEGSMTVRTTRKTTDPYIILKARDLIRLLSRSVPVAQALRILEDDMQCDIIKIGNIVRNKERFEKRRQRLVGPEGATLKAIELLTECYMLVQGNTVSAMGPWRGLKIVRRIVEGCMKNVHPIYAVKELMIKRELAKDPTLKEENWDRFLPKYKPKNVPRKKPPGGKAAIIAKEKAYTPFPPPIKPRKVDLEMESGEYFLSENMKRRKRKTEAQEKSAVVAQQRRLEKEKEFLPPKEPTSKTPITYDEQDDRKVTFSDYDVDAARKRIESAGTKRQRDQIKEEKEQEEDAKRRKKEKKDKKAKKKKKHKVRM